MILQQPESVGQGHSSQNVLCTHQSHHQGDVFQRSIASLVGPILKYISLENIQIYLEKLCFMMMMTMSHLWVDF